MTKKTALLSFLVTAALCLPLLAFPRQLLYPLFGTEDMTLINDTIPYLPLLTVILLVFAAGSIFMNGLIGIGNTLRALAIQATTTVFYIIYIYLVLKVWNLGIGWGWASEVWYWLVMLIVVWRYISSRDWH